MYETAFSCSDIMHSYFQQIKVTLRLRKVSVMGSTFPISNFNSNKVLLWLCVCCLRGMADATGIRELHDGFDTSNVGLDRNWNALALLHVIVLLSTLSFFSLHPFRLTASHQTHTVCAYERKPYNTFASNCSKHSTPLHTDKIYIILILYISWLIRCLRRLYSA